MGFWYCRDRIMIKITKTVLTILLAILLIVGFSYQIKVESFKNKLNDEYSLFVNKDRVKYTPFVIFYIESKLSDKNNVYWDSIHEPYFKKKIDGNYIFNFEYNAYLMYCFYN